MCASLKMMRGYVLSSSPRRASLGFLSYLRIHGLKRATTNGGPYTTIAGSVTASAYTDSSVTPTTTYYYVVSALNSAGESANSAQVTVTTPGQTVPAAPSTLTATAASRSQINLSWKNNATNATGVKIEQSTNGTTFTQIATVGANVTTYSATGLTANTRYYYRVRAYNAVGNSAYSNKASARTAR